MERLDMVLVNFKFGFFLLNFKLGTTSKDVSVIRKIFTLESYDKFFFLLDKFGGKDYFNLLFFFWFKIINKGFTFVKYHCVFNFIRVIITKLEALTVKIFFSNNHYFIRSLIFSAIEKIQIRDFGFDINSCDFRHHNSR